MEPDDLKQQDLKEMDNEKLVGVGTTGCGLELVHDQQSNQNF